MPTMSDVLTKHEVSAADSDWLHRLVGDWQLLSDLSFADLVLWVRSERGDWFAAAHARPTTGVGVFTEDLVGEPVAPARSRMVQARARRPPASRPWPSGSRCGPGSVCRRPASCWCA